MFYKALPWAHVWSLRSPRSDLSAQRGSDYPRVIGSSADIGAYELDTNDVIFVNGFDP